MEGLVAVDKPESWSSFDVVKYVRGIASRALGVSSKKIKVGHSGTLDPAASGLMLILVGKKYTSRAQELTKLDKSYNVTMELGRVSSTGDSEGELRNVSDLRPTKEEIEGSFVKFRGKISQVPPIYSAIQVNGFRAYKLARAGKAVELNPRCVTIYNIKLLGYSYPIVDFACEVSSGTYVRSLVEDIGESLGCGAYTKTLRRTKIGKYSIESAVPPNKINEQTISDLLSHSLL